MLDFSLRSGQRITQRVALNLKGVTYLTDLSELSLRVADRASQRFLLLSTLEESELCGLLSFDARLKLVL